MAVLLLGSALAAVSGSVSVGAQTSCNVSAATTTATNTYDHHRNSGNGDIAAAIYRVFISLGATPPAWAGSQISGAAPTTPITEAQFRAVLSTHGDTSWSGWTPVYTALSCLESATPTVTVSGGAAVTEGADASFTLTAFPAPGANLTVNVTVADSGDFVAGGDEGTDTVTITTSGTAAYTVSTVDDATDEPNGSVKVTVNAGTGYTPANPPSATVAVNDNDSAPGVAEPAGHKQPALTATVVNNGASSRIMVRFPDGLEGVRTVRFAPATQITGDLVHFAPRGATTTAQGGASCSDGADVLTSVVETGSGQNRVGPGADGIWGNGDDDMKWGPIMVTSAIPSQDIAKKSGQVAHVPVKLCPGSEGKTFGLKWDLIPRNPLFESDSFAHDAPNCKDRTYRRAAVPAQTRTHMGTTYMTKPIPELTVHQSHRCWTTVTIVAQDQGGQGSVEEEALEPERESMSAQEEPESEPAAPVCVSAGLSADVEGYAAETWRESADHVSRWSRVLAAFGEANAYSSDPMTAGEAQTYADRGWGRWVPATTALQCLETAAAQQAEAESQPAQNPTPTPTPAPAPTPTPAPTPAPVPQVSVAAGGDVAEGGDAVFTVSASPAPASDLDVAVDVSQTGDYTSATGIRTVTIGASGSATFAVATTDDSADEADGSVTATLNTGSGYTLSPASSASVAVSDDDNPPPPPPPPPVSSGPPTVTVSDATAAEGGQGLAFTVTLSAPNPDPIVFRYGGYGRTASLGHDFSLEYKPYTLAPGDTSIEVTVPVIDDTTPEDTETLRVFVYATNGINIPGYFIYATGTITDND